MPAIVDTIKVCQDCLLVAVNGDDSGRDQSAPEPWNLIPGTDHSLYVHGVQSHGTFCQEHRNSCPDCPDGEDGCEICDCGHDTFNVWPCEACGLQAAGERFTFCRFERTYPTAPVVFPPVSLVKSYVPMEGTQARALSAGDPLAVVTGWLRYRTASDPYVLQRIMIDGHNVHGSHGHLTRVV